MEILLSQTPTIFETQLAGEWRALLTARDAETPLSFRFDGKCAAGYAVTRAAKTVTFAAEGWFGTCALSAALSELFDRVLALPDGGEITGAGAENAAVAAARAEVRAIYYNIWGGGGFRPARWALDYELFRAYDPDIVGCQELSDKWRIAGGFTETMAALGYAEAEVGRPCRNYTPLFYKKDRLEMLDGGYHLFSGLNDADSKSLTWALLRVRETGKRLVAVSTHYWWKSERQEAGSDAVREGDSRELLAELDAVRTRYGAEIPVLVGGDFNCVFESRAISLLTENGLFAAFDAAAAHNDSNGYHAYPEYDEASGAIRCFEAKGTYKNYFSIDHAFVSGALRVARFHTVTDRLSGMTSDHSPELVDLTLL